MNTQETMEDLFPGCSTGRRLQLIRGTLRSHVQKMWQAVQSRQTPGMPVETDCSAPHITQRWATYKLLQRQVQEMEENRENTGFAVTDHELSMAVDQGCFDLSKEPERKKTGWKVIGF